MVAPRGHHWPPVGHPVEALGLRFKNALGLAAGIDKTGESLSELSACGVGHVEVGTVKDARNLRIDPRTKPQDIVVGVSIASPRAGLECAVIDDYLDLLAAAWPVADYVVAGLGMASAGRSGDMAGVEELVEALASRRDALEQNARRYVPVLIKIRGGARGGAIPRAVLAARRFGLDGVVLVTSSPECLRECCREVGPDATVISVGGIASGRDAARRLAAGARLVQIHTLFAADGVSGVKACLGIAGAREDRRCVRL